MPTTISPANLLQAANTSRVGSWVQNQQPAPTGRSPLELIHQNTMMAIQNALKTRGNSFNQMGQWGQQPPVSFGEHNPSSYGQFGTQPAPFDPNPPSPGSVSGPTAGGPLPDHLPERHPESIGGRIFRNFPAPYGANAIPQIYHSIAEGGRERAARDWRERAQNGPIEGTGSSNSEPYMPSGDPNGPIIPAGVRHWWDGFSDDVRNLFNGGEDDGIPTATMDPITVTGDPVNDNSGQPRRRNGPSVNPYLIDPSTGQPYVRQSMADALAMSTPGELAGSPSNMSGRRVQSDAGVSQYHPGGMGYGSTLDGEGGLIERTTPFDTSSGGRGIHGNYGVAARANGTGGMGLQALMRLLGRG